VQVIKTLLRRAQFTHSSTHSHDLSSIQVHPGSMMVTTRNALV
jgi:hypothetical protein